MKPVSRSRRTLVLKAGQSVSELDLWPGDTVIEDASWRLLGAANEFGNFVPNADDGYIG